MKKLKNDYEFLILIAMSIIKFVEEKESHSDLRQALYILKTWL